MPRRQQMYVTKTGMSGAERMFHTLMIAGTFGFWLPVYWARKRSLARVSKTYEA